MRGLLLALAMMALICSPAMAGKNTGGAMVVHTDDAVSWTNGICDQFDSVVLVTCPELNTRTDKDANTPALIWFIAAFPSNSSPGVTVCYFGHDHPLPEFYHNRWAFCGPAGTIEIPDAGWPDAPATAGNSVAFGSPIVGDVLFPFYYFDVWGYEDVYYCTAINPVGGYAGYVDDSNPPELDEINLFGCARWYTAGYNECPSDEPIAGACCFDDGSCQLTADEPECLGLGGYTWLGEGTVCSPNPCAQPGACCFEDGSCTHVIEETCTQTGGSQWIAEMDCDPNPCPQPDGACCAPDGSCTLETEVACSDVWLGPGTVCDPNPCPQPGACCFEDGSCTYVI